jgi:hypothetical protein
MSVPVWLNRDRAAVLGAIFAPPAIVLAMVPFRDSFANTDAALVLVLVVVAIAANGYRLAGTLAAVSAGVWFDFFLTRPYEHLTITRAADIETAMLLLIVGVGVSELALRGRRHQARASRETGYLAGIQAATEVMARGGSTGPLIEEICGQLTSALGLRGCRFQAGVAGLGDPPRLQRDGQVLWHRQVWDVEHSGLPVGTEIELLVEHGGRLYGRFMLSAAGPTRVSLEQRRVAVTLADHVGAALH